MVTRYDALLNFGAGMIAGGNVSETGPYVSFADYKALEADLALYREFVDLFDAWCKSDGDRPLWQAMLAKREGLP